MENQKKRIGIIGGTFNPIHLGHLLLAETAKDNFKLDEILFIPSGCSYMKNPDKIADKDKRYEMAALAIEDNPAFRISSIEVEREGNSYTCETLEKLTESEPCTEFYFIVGADSLFSMETWKNPQKIFSLCTVLAAVRDDKDRESLNKQIVYFQDKYGANVELLSLKEITISSTDIRNKIKEGKSIRYMVPDKVIAYIRENSLYYNS